MNLKFLTLFRETSSKQTSGRPQVQTCRTPPTEKHLAEQFQALEALKGDSRLKKEIEF